MKSLTIAVLTILHATTAIAQSPAQPAEPTQVFRSGVSLVAVNVTVTDREKRYVTGLSADDFAVFENGIQQEVQFFESAAVPLDLIVLLDTSSSMGSRMEIVHKAALGFLSTLREGDRGAVVAFSDRVDILQPLTTDHAALETAVRGTTANGGTALRNALYVALKQFGRPARQTGEVRRQAIVMLSDGEDTASLLSFDDVLEVARTSGVSVYPIALDSQRSTPPVGNGRFLTDAQYAMRQLAQETGAQAFFPNAIGDLTGIYATIAKELSNQYSIGYSPTNARPDGLFRRILVRIISRPELRLRARSGYLAAPQRSVLVNRNVPR